MKMTSYTFETEKQLTDFRNELLSISKQDWIKISELFTSNISISFRVFDLNGMTVLFAAYYY